MVKLITSAATVLVLMPVIWVSAAAWATGLSVGLVANEVRNRCKCKAQPSAS